ncbi:MAG: helix-turn-helix transcriptional regulator [Streptomyces sp.]|uniref:helix-turn-helix transcriptional regulator n=1 Tax=Streptomyces sp. NBC_00028 TaxID=2975624 RepID=UPI001834B7B4|nr:helix-turn-helix transcriptional regulator [Streptomyces sp.]NUP21288.1 helix-turn-helix transcriptional regulator [Streptomyces sp.]NUS80926.1 helix-turn-helix transcriptional regulator [Streptomyces sp.]
MLVSLGLTEQSDRLYRAILRRPDLAVADAAKELGVTEDVVREELEELTRLSLLTPAWRRDNRLRVVAPKAALDSLLAHQQAEIVERQRALAESQAAADALLTQYAELHPEEPEHEAERFLGVEAVRAKITELTADVRTEIISFHPGGPQPAAQFEASEPITTGLLDRGVTVKGVYQDSIRNDQVSVEHARWLTERSGELRTVPALPMRMIILDRQKALVPIDPDDSSLGAVLLREPGAVAAFCALFDAVWDTATPFGEPARRSLDDPGSQPRELLRLLAQGYTDEAAARRLGISLRSERRLISELMEKLDAQSRFQLGQRAVEHGLL